MSDSDQRVTSEADLESLIQSATDRGDLSAALAHVEVACNLYEHREYFWLCRGWLSAQLNMPEAAEHAYRAATRVAPESPTALQHLSGYLAHQGKHAEVLDVLLPAAARFPEHLDLAIATSSTAFALERFDIALHAAMRAVALNADSWHAHLAAGNALFHLGRPQDALGHFERGIALDRDRATLWLGAANALAELDCAPLAKVAAERGLALDPQCANLWAAHGIALYYLRDLTGAVRSMRRAVDLRPDFGPGHGNLANALSDLGEVREAMRSVDRAIHLTPKESHLWVRKAILLWSDGNTSAGLDAIEQAIGLDDRDALLWANLAHLQLQHATTPSSTKCPHSIESCLARAARLISLRPRKRGETLRVLVPALLQYSELPLLAYRFATHYLPASSYLTFATQLRQCEQKSEIASAALSFLSDPNTALSEHDRLLLKGKLQLAFGDPCEALITLDALDSLDPTETVGSMYLAWAMALCGEDSSTHLAYALGQARDGYEHGTLSTKHVMAYGHLLLEDKRCDEAIQVFAGIMPNSAPASAMAWYTATIIGDSAMAAQCLDNWMAVEYALLQRNEPGVLCAGQTMLASLSWAALCTALPAILARFECRNAVELAMQDESVLAHSGLSCLIGSGCDAAEQWADQYQISRMAWAQLTADQTALIAWRAACCTSWIEAQRLRLQNVLSWLGGSDLEIARELQTNKDATPTQSAKLASALADRVLYSSMVPKHDELVDCVRLLFVTGLLVAKDAQALIMYVLCRQAFVDGQRMPHLRAVITHALTGMCGLAAYLLGMTRALELVATMTGMHMVGDVVADHISRWVESMRADGAPFPRLDAFRRNIVDYVERNHRLG